MDTGWGMSSVRVCTRRVVGAVCAVIAVSWLSARVLIDSISRWRRATQGRRPRPDQDPGHRRTRDLRHPARSAARPSRSRRSVPDADAGRAGRRRRVGAGPSARSGRKPPSVAGPGTTDEHHGALAIIVGFVAVDHRGPDVPTAAQPPFAGVAAVVVGVVGAIVRTESSGLATAAQRGVDDAGSVAAGPARDCRRPWQTWPQPRTARCDGWFSVRVGRWVPGSARCGSGAG